MPADGLPGIAGLRALAASRVPSSLFVTVSGAHLYGFPSPDSDIDIDLRGAHLLPLEEVLGLRRPTETVELDLEHEGREVELVSHDLGKYLRLLVKHNGYILEQIFSPLVVLGEGFLSLLRPVAAACIGRRLYHHYRGFLGTQLGLLEKERPPRVKALLYCYRVVLTGIHVLRTGQIEASLPVLNRAAGLPYIDDLIHRKRAGETAAAGEIDLTFHRSELARLEGELGRAFEESRLPEEIPIGAVHDLLVAARLGRLPGWRGSPPSSPDARG
jgi:predicted nucleotidyltransferase